MVGKTKDLSLQKFNITDVAIKKMSDEYLPLTINGLSDKEGYAKVKQARIIVKSKRVEVEKTRKELKADALAFGRKVDGEAKRITSLLLPIEENLKSKEQAIDNEKKRIAEEQDRKAQEKLQDRINKLKAVNADFLVSEIITLEDDDFTQLLENATEAYKIEEERLAEINRQKEIEAKRLEEQRKEQEKKERELAEKEAAMRAEQEKIEAEKRAILEAKAKEEAERQRKIEIEKARKEAEEAAIKRAEEEAKRKEWAKAEAERLAKEEAERIEQAKPDKEKLLSLSNTIKNIQLPKLKTKKAIHIIEQTSILLTKVCNYINEESNKLTIRKG